MKKKRIFHTPNGASTSKSVLNYVSNYIDDSNHFAWAAKYIDIHSARCEFDADYISRNIKGETLLNVGGAPFIFEYLLKNRRKDIFVTSIDLNPERLRRLVDAIDVAVISANIEESGWQSKLENNKFDIVCMCEVFEHLRINILDTMAAVFSVISEGGKLYLTTPNGVGFFKQISNIRHGKTGPSLIYEWSKLQNIGHMGHVREYSACEVISVLRHVGFEKVELMYRNWQSKNRIWYKLRSAVTAAYPGLADELVIIAER